MKSYMDKREIWALIRDIYPPNDNWIDELEELDFGYYVGGDTNYWFYNDARHVPDVSREELWDIYVQLKRDSGR